MGTGSSGLGRDSGGVKNITDKVKSAIKGLRVQANSAGYTLKDSKALREHLSVDEFIKRAEERGSKYFPPGSAEARAQERLEAIQEQFNQLNAYRAAMGDTTNTGTTIVYKTLSGGATASTDTDNNIKVDGIWEKDNLVHEHTHNMMHTLIEKELGFPKGSIEYKAAYMKGTIEKDIQDNAFRAWYKDKYGSEFQPGHLQSGPTAGDIKNAVTESNFRDYALRQYFWAPKGTYIEITTVAAEHFL